MGQLSRFLFCVLFLFAFALDVCFVLADKWSPALQIRTVLLSIQALLSAPNPDDPLDTKVADQWKHNEAAAIETGKDWMLDCAFQK